MEISNGNKPDISKFRFHFWEPIWFFEPTKTPKSNWRKVIWLGFSHSTGDNMTYYVETEDTPKPQVITRSCIKTRIKNIGMKNEYVEDSTENSDFLKDDE